MNIRVKSLVLVVFMSVVLGGCNHDSSDESEGNGYCKNPADLNGVYDTSAPGYIVYFKDDVDTVSEVNRLIDIYEIEVGAVYDALNGFFGEMSESTRERLRCEASVDYVHFNGVVTTQ